MKSLLIIVLLHFYFASALPTDNNKAKAKAHLMDISTNCRNKEGATEIDVEDMLNHIAPTTKIGKCFNACMMEQYEIIVDGKYNVDGVITLANLTSDNSEKVNNLVTILANECKSSVIDSDRCELSLKITQCLDNTAKKRGITDTDFI